MHKIVYTLWNIYAVTHINEFSLEILGFIVIKLQRARDHY